MVSSRTLKLKYFVWDVTVSEKNHIFPSRNSFMANISILFEQFIFDCIRLEAFRLNKCAEIFLGDQPYCCFVKKRHFRDFHLHREGQFGKWSFVFDVYTNLSNSVGILCSSKAKRNYTVIPLTLPVTMLTWHPCCHLFSCICSMLFPVFIFLAFSWSVWIEVPTWSGAGNPCFAKFKPCLSVDIIQM